MQGAKSRYCTDVPVQQNLEWSISIKCKVVVVSTAALRRLRSHRPRGRPTQTKDCAYICSSFGGITRTEEMIPRRVGLLNSECLVPRPTMHSSVSLEQGSTSTTRAKKSSWGRDTYSVLCVSIQLQFWWMPALPGPRPLRGCVFEPVCSALQCINRRGHTRLVC